MTTTSTPTLKPLPLADTNPVLEDGVPPPHLMDTIVMKPERLASLDIFRGITIAAMLIVNNAGGPAYAPLRHAEWHGWTLTDLIFPFFLFIVGVAIPFSMAKRASTGALSRGQLLAGIWARSLSLVLLGLLLAAIPMWMARVDPSGRPGPELPEGFTLLRAVRWFAAIYVTGAFLALLFPWRSRRLATLVPVAVAVGLVALYWVVMFVTRHAMASGLPENFIFGNGILTPWRMRFPGVLQRIGICYGVAATIALFAGWRTVLTSAFVLMAVYSVLMLKAPSFNGHVPGSLAKEDNLQRKVDERVFGDSKTGRNHNYSYPDPEGLLSTLPAIGSTLLGILIGLRLRSENRTPAERGVSVLAWGVATACVGVLLSWWLMPVNKQIWTPSFTVLTAGLGMLGLGAVYYVADIKRRRAWGWVFKVFGMNAILAFVLAGVLGRASSLIKIERPLTDREVKALSARQPSTAATQESAGLVAKKKTHPVEYARDYVAEGMHRADDWLAAHARLPEGAFAAPKNVSLAQAIAFVLIIFLPLTLLYFCRVFIKV